MTSCDTDSVHITCEVHRGLIDDTVPKWYAYNCLTENGENITVQKRKT